MESGLGQFMRLYFGQYRGKKLRRCFTTPHSCRTGISEIF